MQPGPPGRTRRRAAWRLEELLRLPRKARTGQAKARIRIPNVFGKAPILKWAPVHATLVRTSPVIRWMPEEWRRRVSLIAINVLLDPDAATVEKARAVNARLRESYPDGFTLDANHAPHITLLQRFVRTADVDLVAKAVTEVLRTGLSMRWESRATGYYDLAYKNLGLVGIVIEPTEGTDRIHG